MAYPTMDIKSWAVEDRPREKLILKGKSVLSDAELIAILIGSGTSKYSAVDLGKIILKSVDNDLSKLAGLSVKDLTKFKGIGDAKAIAIVSALELGRRRKESDPQTRVKITSSNSAYEFLKPKMLDLKTEEFWIILLNRANYIIRDFKISEGGVSGTVADAKIIFSKALENLASSIILAHNHPSGNLSPSASDRQLTDNAVKAGKVLSIDVIDHIIFTNTGYYSFKDEGAM